MLVVDEAHYVKNPQTRTVPHGRPVGRACERVLFLTGTPMENRVSEFRNLVRPPAAATAPGHRGRGRRRRIRGVPPGGGPGRTCGATSRTCWQNCPSLQQTDEWEELSAADQDAYREAVRAGNFMAMRRAAYARPEKSAKLQRLRELGRGGGGERAEGRGVLLLPRRARRGDRSRLGPEARQRLRCSGRSPASVPAGRRQQIVDEFAAVAGHAVLLAQIEAGGRGPQHAGGLRGDHLRAAGQADHRAPGGGPRPPDGAGARRSGCTGCSPPAGVDERMLEILESKSRLFDAYARRSDVGRGDPRRGRRLGRFAGPPDRRGRTAQTLAPRGMSR